MSLLAHSSQSDLASILKTLHEGAIEGGIDRSTLSREQASATEGMECTFELKLTDGSDFTWTMLNPARLFSHMVEGSECLQEILAEALRRHGKPTSEAPWGLIVGFDEFCLGDKLRTNNRRKCMVSNFTIKEFEVQRLWRDLAWFTFLVLRSEVIGKTEGGWSHLAALFLKEMLLGPEGFTTAGVPVTVHGSAVLMICKPSNLFSDGDGLRMVLSWRGANAIRPCFRHANLVSKRSHLVEFGAESDLCDVSCSDFQRFRSAEDEYIEETMVLIVEAENAHLSGNMSLTQIRKICTCSGYKVNRKGIQADASLRGHLRLVETATYDWLHCCLQDGLINVEIYNLLVALEEEKVCTFRDLELLFKDGWCFPAATKRKGDGIFRIFDEYRSRSCHEHEKLKCSAAEVLSMYGLLRHYISIVEAKHGDGLSEGVKLRIASFHAACAIVDCILDAKRGTVGIIESAAALRACLKRFIECHKRAYGIELLRPKHHWLWDIAEQWLRDHCVLDCFPIERLHAFLRVWSYNIRSCLRKDCAEGFGARNALCQEPQGCASPTRWIAMA